MVDFVGAGCGAKDLITLRGLKLIQQADVIIYAGSLVNPELLEYAKPGCEIHNSALMTLDEVISVMSAAESAGKRIVRLHTGDPSLYGAIREQMSRLDGLGISYAVCPGVSSFCGAAAALRAEYTLPAVSQTVIITRMAGRTPVPERESIRIPRGAWLHDGDFPQHGHAGGAFRAADKRRLLHGYSRRDSLQGKLAGRKSLPLHRWYARRNSLKK